MTRDTPLLHRRALLGGVGALLAAPALARTASASRGFTIFRGDSRIGRHVVTVSRDVRDLVTVKVEVDIRVRVLGITAYRYQMRNTETWRDGKLQTLDSRVDDDGAAKFSRARREGGGLRVEGSGYQGQVDGDAATTTYVSPAALSRSPWISTDDGEPFRVTAYRGGTRRIAGVECARWRVTNGDIYTVELFYTPAGEWASVEFDARGETARYQPDSLGGGLAAIWAG